MRTRLLLAALASAASALAEPTGREPAVIEPGREAEVLALLAPYALGQEVTPGWKLWNVRILPRAIEVELLGPNGATARVRLTEAGDAAEHSASFAIERPRHHPAAEAVVGALRHNDRGGFWRVRADEPGGAAAPASSGVAWPLGVAVVAAAAMVWLARVRRAHG